MEIFRQGDVVLRRMENPVNFEGAKDQGDPVLAYGETTGHSHRITEGNVQFIRLLTGMVVLRVLSDQARLFHETHPDVLLDRGDYEVAKQREVDWMSSTMRNVAD